jgi:hypothetical protein
MSLTIQYDFSPSTFIASSNTITNIAPITNPSQYNGTVIGSPTMGPPGVTSLSTSVSFNSTKSQYIQLPGMILPSDGISFAFWFKSNNSSSFARIFDFGNGTPSNNILLAINGGNLYYCVFNGITSYNKQIATNVNDNTWRHIVWTLSPNPNVWNIYVNGNLTNTFTSGIYYPNSVFMNYLYIGKSIWSFDPYLNGNLADFRIYFGTPLTQSQIANIYNQDLTVSSAVTGNSIINSGYNELYNQIYCDLYPTNNGFNQCQNCNFGNQAILSTTTQSGEQSCLTACKNSPQCTSYSYNLTKSTNNCTQNSNFPTEIINNVQQINSGYSINKFGYNYNNLSAIQKTNVQQKCAKQYLDNYFTNGKNIDLSKCLTFPTPNKSTDSTNFTVDPQCLYNTYNSNNIPTKIQNNSVYVDTAPGITTISTGDNTIDNYRSSYKDYITKQVQISNINNSAGNNNNYNDDMNNNRMFNTFKASLVENFENNNNSHYLKLFIILIIIIIIVIIIYIFGKK